jgi:hypothetical protein
VSIAYIYTIAVYDKWYVRKLTTFICIIYIWEYLCRSSHHSYYINYFKIFTNIHYYIYTDLCLYYIYCYSFNSYLLLSYVLFEYENTSVVVVIHTILTISKYSLIWITIFTLIYVCTILNLLLLHILISITFICIIYIWEYVLRS